MHVVVIVCDCLPLGLLGCYGNEWIDTPNLDRLAHGGCVFDQCYPTQPTDGGWLGAGLTGQCGFFSHGQASVAPLASLIRDRGIRSALFTDHCSLQTRTQAGSSFETVAHVQQPLVEESNWATLDDLARDPRFRIPEQVDERAVRWINRWREQLGRERLLGDSAEQSVESVLVAALDWMTSHRGADTLVWLELGFRASGWQPPEEFRNRWPGEPEGNEILDFIPGFLGEEIAETELPRLRAGQAGRVAFLDAALGGFLNRLRDICPLQETLIVFTANQGLPLGEHGVLGNHRPWIYEELDHVPLILSLDGDVDPSRNQALVQSTDIYGSIHEFFDIRADSSTPRASLLALARGAESKIRDYCCAGIDDCEYAIRTHQWKLIVPVRSIPDDGPRDRELYAKPEDRWEVHNQCDQALEIADLLELQLRRHIDAVRRGTLGSIVPMRERPPG